MYQPRFKRNKKNVPILSKKEIDEIAEGYVLDFHPETLSHPQPINVELFLEKYLGLTLDFQYLSHDGSYLGMTVFNNTNLIPVFIPEENRAEYFTASEGTVIIDVRLTADNQLNRYRYTCGHEGGHWVLHKAFYHYNPNQLTFFELNTPYVQCREISHSEFSTDTRTWDDNRWMEWQADKFSSSFLMPKSAVLKVVNDNPLIQDSDSSLIRLVSETFQTSASAACYRLKDLGIVGVRKNAGQLPLLESLSFQYPQLKCVSSVAAPVAN